MLKHWFNRLSHIASGSFGLGKGEGFGLEASLTKFERFFHFWVLVGRSFARNRCPVRASALSFNTLLALIPMLAVSMSITSVFLKSKGEEQIKLFIEQMVDRIAPAGHLSSLPNSPGAAPDAAASTNQIPAAPESNAIPSTVVDPSGVTNYTAALGTVPPVAGGPADAQAKEAGKQEIKRTMAQDAANYIYQFARRSHSGTLGVTGMFFLAITAIMTLTRVEETFNDIWGVTRGRDWWARITNYFFTIALGPGMIIVALGLMSGPVFQKSREYLGIVPFLQPVLTSLLPVAIICLTFTLLYKLVPNTKVDFSAALVGGTLAGLAWNGYNQLGFLLASQAVSASAVYGSLFMVPLLMGGLYVVWLTVLFGAQVAYAFQNRASYLQEQLAENVNQRGREFVALRLMTCIGQRFAGGQPPATIRKLSGELGIPTKLVQQVLRTLLAAGLVAEVNGAEPAYTPARPLEAINCHHILTAMRATHGQEPATRDEPVRVEVLGEFARIQAAEREAASTVTMLALVQRADSRLVSVGAGQPVNETKDFKL
jgi:membrane protein